LNYVIPACQKFINHPLIDNDTLIWIGCLPQLSIRFVVVSLSADEFSNPHIKKMVDNNKIAKPFIHLDTISLLEAHVGYGELGLHGSLGYEDKEVMVQGQLYRHALSTHPPARMSFELGGRFASFRSQVALNDDAQMGESHADFVVIADGRQVAAAPYVVAGETPRNLNADIGGAHTLELEVRTNRWEHCHAVWLDPQVSEFYVDVVPGTLLDCLARTVIKLPMIPPRAKRCIATVVSPGFETLLDDMLGSLYANGECQDALLVVFAVDRNPAIERVIAKYQATAIYCKSYARVNPTVKSALYSVARVVDANQFLCLDADMLVLGDLRPVFSAIDACLEGSILVCREGNGNGFKNLSDILSAAYGGKNADLKRLSGGSGSEGAYSLVVNDGLFAGSRSALLSLDNDIRTMTEAPEWTDERRDIWWRNQFVFNLSLARLQNGVELNPKYNIQLHTQDVQFDQLNGGLKASWGGQPVRVLHFSGNGRKKYSKWRNLFSRVHDPLVGRGGGNNYDRFLTALRRWIGRHGVNGLAWSFYGTADALSARVRDSSKFPLLAMLHYLIRANGCIRVLETGTARGVSAACLASAVAHRPGGCVVTFDPSVYPERKDLWAILPEEISDCIEPRTTGSIEGMSAALDKGERYDAVLLDSLHNEEHVWAEFKLATELVCFGGLILIHDVCLAQGTVDKAVERIKKAGYGVVRLWAAETGISEDDNLGLAIIENLRHPNRMKERRLNSTDRANTR
jgi:predicted O-methyltransferase YrrM